MDQRIEITRVVLESIGLDATEKRVKETLPIWWQNPRQKDSGGLRLTDQGYTCLKQADIKDYKIDLPKEIEWTNQLIIRMDQFIDCPFYLTKKAIYVFGEKMAVQLVLFSGNIQKYGLSKAMSVARKQQESS
jgi:hypothetical protein